MIYEMLAQVKYKYDAPACTNITNPQFIRVDAPPVMKDRTTGGKGRVPARRPAHIARRTTSLSGNAAAGRKNASVIIKILRDGYLEVIVEVVTLELSAICDLDLEGGVGEGSSIGVEGYGLNILYGRCGFLRGIGGPEHKAAGCGLETRMRFESIRESEYCGDQCGDQCGGKFRVGAVLQRHMVV